MQGFVRAPEDIDPHHSHDDAIVNAGKKAGKALPLAQAFDAAGTTTRPAMSEASARAEGESNGAKRGFESPRSCERQPSQDDASRVIGHDPNLKAGQSSSRSTERPCHFANASPTLRATADVSAEVMFDIAATTIPRSRTVTTDITLAAKARSATRCAVNSPS